MRQHSKQMQIVDDLAETYSLRGSVLPYWDALDSLVVLGWSQDDAYALVDAAYTRNLKRYGASV